MTWTTFFIALALVAIIEGIGPLLFHRNGVIIYLA